MKKIIILTVVTMFASVSAYGAPKIQLLPYASIGGGAATNSFSGAAVDDWGYTIEGALGVTINTRKTPQMRVEMEFAYARFDGDDTQHINATTDRYVTSKQIPVTYMGNYFVDFFKKSFIHPYVGVGLGVMDFKDKISIKNIDLSTGTSTTVDDTENSYNKFVYGLYAGVAIDLLPEYLVLDAGIRYKDSDKFDTTTFTLRLRSIF